MSARPSELEIVERRCHYHERNVATISLMSRDYLQISLFILKTLRETLNGPIERSTTPDGGQLLY